MKAILFDMDGVIIDSGTRIEEFWRQWGERYGVTFSAEDFRARLHGTPARQIVAEYFPEVSEADYAAIVEEGARPDGNGRREPPEHTPVAGVLEFLGQLRAAGVPAALVTSARTGKAQEVIAQFDLADVFGSVVTADRVEHGKPAPDGYRLAARELGVDPADCLVFEDAVTGTKAGRAAGARVCGINQPEVAPLLRDAGAFAVLPDFGAVRLVKGVLEPLGLTLG